MPDQSSGVDRDAAGVSHAWEKFGRAVRSQTKWSFFCGSELTHSREEEIRTEIMGLRSPSVENKRRSLRETKNVLRVEMVQKASMQASQDNY